MPSEQQLVADILGLAGVSIVGQCATMAEAQELFWNTMTNGSDHLVVAGEINPSPLLGYAAEPKQTINGWFGPLRVFGRQYSGAGRPAATRLR